jgi:hypothetical protein
LHAPDRHGPDDAQVQELLRDAAKQYESYLSLAKLTDLTKVATAANAKQASFRPAPLSLVLRSKGT